MSDTLESQFLELKEMESQIKERLYMLEQKIAMHYGYDVVTGKSKSFKTNDYDVKFTSSQVRKVDYEKLRDIQKQYAIPDQEIERLFRLKAEVNSSEFNSLPQENKDILNGAITVQINKPTLKITPIKKD